MILKKVVTNHIGFSESFHVEMAPSGGAINLNDGLEGGRLELGQAYRANMVHYAPNSGDLSGLFNLRLRRFLNAYGDGHKFVSDTGGYPVARKDEFDLDRGGYGPVSYTHLRAHETLRYLVCRLLLEKKKK